MSIGSMRKLWDCTKEHVGLLLRVAGGFGGSRLRELERLDSFFPSAFTNKVSQAPVLRGRVQGKEEQSAVDDDEVREHFRGLMLNKSTLPAGLHR